MLLGRVMSVLPYSVCCHRDVLLDNELKMKEPEEDGRNVR